MSNEPSPEPSDPQAEAAKRYRPSIMLFTVVYAVMFGIHLLFRGPMPAGETHISLLAYSVISAVFAGGFITVYLRSVRKLTWWQALAYSATVVGAMFCADVARIFLLYR